MYGFVEHLEWEDLTPPTSQGGVADINMEDVEQTVDVLRIQLKEEIVRLLTVCVQCPGVSIGRLLLGFMQPPFEKKKMKTVALQDPGGCGHELYNNKNLLYKQKETSTSNNANNYTDIFMSKPSNIIARVYVLSNYMYYTHCQ